MREERPGPERVGVTEEHGFYRGNKGVVLAGTQVWGRRGSKS